MSEMDFTGKRFDYLENNKTTQSAKLWFQYVKDINIQTLFRPFFDNMDREIEGAMERNLQTIHIMYPQNIVFEGVNDTFFSSLRNAQKSGTLPLLSLLPYEINDIVEALFNQLKPFYVCCKSIDGARTIHQLFLYHPYYFKIARNKEIENNGNGKSLSNPVLNTSSRLSIEFIEYLFTFNGYDFREIICDKIKNVKTITFLEDKLIIQFY